MLAPPPNFSEPCYFRIRQDSLPDITLGLSNRNFHLGHIYFSAKPCPNLLETRGLEEKLQGLPKVAPGLFHIVPWLAISNSGHNATPSPSRSINAPKRYIRDMSFICSPTYPSFSSLLSLPPASPALERSCRSTARRRLLPGIPASGVHPGCQPRPGPQLAITAFPEDYTLDHIPTTWVVSGGSAGAYPGNLAGGPCQLWCSLR